MPSGEHLRALLPQPQDFTERVKQRGMETCNQLTAARAGGGGGDGGQDNGGKRGEGLVKDHVCMTEGHGQQGGD